MSENNGKPPRKAKGTERATGEKPAAPELELEATPAQKPGYFLVVARNRDKEVHRDTLDLNSATGRKRFVGETLAAVFRGRPADDWPDGCREKLADELLDLARVPPGGSEAAPTPADAEDDPRIAELEKMPDDVRAEAAALLEDPDLMDRIADDAKSAGVVGEMNLVQTLYAIGTSAQLPVSLGGVVKGPSSSGKSYTVERVADLFPPEVVLRATDITTNALYYMPPGSLRHRWVVAGERSRLDEDERAEATRALREMLSGGRLSKLVTMKVEGELASVLIEQEGPIAYTETTTLSRIFEEDANRCLLLNTDESEEQTKRILAMAAVMAAGRRPADLGRLREVHHAAQRMIPRADVVIPFAECLHRKFPTARLEVRRDFPRLLQLVKAVGLLHFRQRERDAEGRVVATVDDYRHAARLARGPLAAAAGGISAGAAAYLTALRRKFDENEFTTTDAQNVGGGSERTKYNRLLELNTAGAVHQVVPGKGRVPAKWKLAGGFTPTAGQFGLPTAEEITAEFGCKLADKG